MKVKRININFITNVILCVTLIFVCFVSFYPASDTVFNENGDVYYNGDTSKKNVSLMFNVYESAENVSAIMDILGERDVKATFFVGGCWADDNGEILQRMVAEGHEIGNHGYFHLDHSGIGEVKNLEEITNTEKMVVALCGYQTKLFAPPSGAYSKVTLQVAEKLGYKVIMWTKDTIDWRDYDSELVFSRATKDLSGGDLILMHPKAHTVEALPKILDFIEQNGFNQTTVGETIGIEKETL